VELLEADHAVEREGALPSRHGSLTFPKFLDCSQERKREREVEEKRSRSRSANCRKDRSRRPSPSSIVRNSKKSVHSNRIQLGMELVLLPQSFCPRECLAIETSQAIVSSWLVSLPFRQQCRVGGPLLTGGKLPFCQSHHHRSRIMHVRNKEDFRKERLGRRLACNVRPTAITVPSARAGPGA
jgi:hypothetical protein